MATRLRRLLGKPVRLVSALKQYISSQEQHRQKYSFEDELRTFLMKYGISFDERYLWDRFIQPPTSSHEDIEGGPAGSARR